MPQNDVFTKLCIMNKVSTRMFKMAYNAETWNSTILYINSFEVFFVVKCFYLSKNRLPFHHHPCCFQLFWKKYRKKWLNTSKYITPKYSNVVVSFCFYSLCRNRYFIISLCRNRYFIIDIIAKVYDIIAKPSCYLQN